MEEECACLRRIEMLYTQSACPLLVPNAEWSNVSYSAGSTRPRSGLILYTPLPVIGAIQLPPTIIQFPWNIINNITDSASATPITPIGYQVFPTYFSQTQRNSLFSMSLYGKINERHQWGEKKEDLPPSLKLCCPKRHQLKERAKQIRFTSLYTIQEMLKQQKKSANML